MELRCKAFSTLCTLEVFEINGIKAHYKDFGTKEDVSRNNTGPYCCGNMKFIPHSRPKKEILEKYNINYEEWFDICEKLDEELSFGYCCWCS